MSIKPNTMTVLCHLTGTINIAGAAIFLPIVRLYDSCGNPIEFKAEKEKTDGTKIKSRISLKNYGLDKVLISCRHDNICRGIRQGGKRFSHSVAVDYQGCNKNIHCKISKTKFILTGILSEEMGRQASEGICDILRMTQNNLEYVKKNMTIEIYEDLKNFYNYKGKGKIYDIFCSYMDEYDDVENFMKFVDSVLNISEICSPDIHPDRQELTAIATMSIIDYNGELPLILLAQYLKFQGMNIFYDNSRGAEINIQIKSGNKIYPATLHKGKRLKNNTGESLYKTKEIQDIIKKQVYSFIKLYESGEIYNYLKEKRLRQ